MSTTINDIKPIRFLLHQDSDFNPHDSADQLARVIKNTLIKNNYRTLSVSRDLSENLITEAVELIGGSISSGIHEGCYGARTGKILKGYTLQLPLELFQEYYDHDLELILLNPLHEIDTYGGELLDLDNEQIEGFLDCAHDMGLDLHHDSTYNHEFVGCDYVCNFDFKMIGDYENNQNVLIAKFHCGGDIRGNYTRWYAFKFDDTGDLYNVLFLYREIK